MVAAITIAQVTQALSITATDVSDPYLWEYAKHPSLRIRALDRATSGAEHRIDNPDGSAVVFRLLGVPAVSNATVSGPTLTASTVTITMQEVAGVLRAKYILTIPTKPASLNAQWTVTLIGGAGFRLNADKTASILDASGHVTYTQPAPAATNKNGAAVTITPSYVAPTLTYAMPSNIATSAFPVTIDPTTISTSTVATATEFSNEAKLVYAPSDGLATLFWWDGSNIAYSTSASPHTSWNAKVNPVSATDLGFTVVVESNDNINLFYKITSGSNRVPRHVLLTRSGSTYTVSAVHTVTTFNTITSASLSGRDAQTTSELWAVFQATKNIGSLFSPDGVTWTAGATTWGANTGPGSDFGFAITSTHLVVLVPTAATTLTAEFKTLASANNAAWTAGNTVTIPTAAAGDTFATAVDGSGRVIVALGQATPSVAVRTWNYTPASTWSAATDLGESTTLDKYVTLLKVGSDVYCFWYNTSTKVIWYKIWSNASSTWGSATSLLTTTNAATWLTVGLQGSAAIGVAWTEGTGSPFNIQYAEIALATTSNLALAATTKLAQASLTETYLSIGNLTLAASVKPARASLTETYRSIGNLQLSATAKAATGSLAESYRSIGNLTLAATTKPATGSLSLVRTLPQFNLTIAASVKPATGSLAETYRSIGNLSLQAATRAATASLTETYRSLGNLSLQAASRAAVGALTMTRTVPTFNLTLSATVKPAAGALTQTYRSVSNLSLTVTTKPGQASLSETYRSVSNLTITPHVAPAIATLSMTRTVPIFSLTLVAIVRPAAASLTETYRSLSNLSLAASVPHGAAALTETYRSISNLALAAHVSPVSAQLSLTYVAAGANLTLSTGVAQGVGSLTETYRSLSSLSLNARTTPAQGQVAASYRSLGNLTLTAHAQPPIASLSLVRTLPQFNLTIAAVATQAQASITETYRSLSALSLNAQVAPGTAQLQLARTLPQFGLVLTAQTASAQASLTMSVSYHYELTLAAQATRTQGTLALAFVAPVIIFSPPSRPHTTRVDDSGAQALIAIDSGTHTSRALASGAVQLVVVDAGERQTQVDASGAQQLVAIGD